jgi:predicted nucleic acid-binding protein
MIVVADTGPLHYLILLDHAELLHRFYDEVVVPDAVATESRRHRRQLQYAIGYHVLRNG